MNNEKLKLCVFILCESTINSEIFANENVFIVYGESIKRKRKNSSSGLSKPESHLRHLYIEDKELHKYMHSNVAQVFQYDEFTVKKKTSLTYF